MAIIFANLSITILILTQEDPMKLFKSIIALACFSAFTIQAMQESKEPKELLAAHAAKAPLLTADEVARIQTICISNVWWKRSLISPNFKEMAHGNTELENELRGLYQCPGYISAKLTFRGLCQKWGLDTSKLDRCDK